MEYLVCPAGWIHEWFLVQIRLFGSCSSAERHCFHPLCEGRRVVSRELTSGLRLASLGVSLHTSTGCRLSSIAGLVLVCGLPQVTDPG